MARILRMSEDEVDQTLARTLSRYADRYRDLRETLERHFRLVAHRLGDETNVSTARQHLIGAYFTQEYALEAAALFNPSIVPHPDQARCGRGELRFIMSLRAVGEGHVSSIEFRSGTIGNDGAITIDEPGRFLDTGHIRPVAYDREFFKEKLAQVSHDDESAQLLWSLLPSRFSMAELDRAVSELSLQQETRTGSLALIDWVRWIARPTTKSSSTSGMICPSGFCGPQARTRATAWRMPGSSASSTTDSRPTTRHIRAFDGRSVGSHLLETRDFRTFTVCQLSGPSTGNKGMALFPRRIRGRYAALSRWDRENNCIAYSDDRHRWGPPITIQEPARPWELVQLGNCGSPIETSAGWLVFTHGVGPMREYAIGAMLLDLDNPERLVSVLPEPLLTADESEREGYVPNALYSCGSLLHEQTIVLPYACSDTSVRIAMVHLARLLDLLKRD